MASVVPPSNVPQQEEVDINLNDPQVGEAAKKIQNVFRNRKQDKKTSPASGADANGADATKE